MPRIPRAIKEAAVAQVNEAREAGLPVSALVADLAAQHGVGVRRVWAWCAGEGLGGRKTAVLTRDELIAIASCQGNCRRAHMMLRADGKCDLSYSQFMRRLAATDTYLRVGVTEGMAAVHQVGLYNVQKGIYERGDVLGFDHTEIPVFIAEGSAPPAKVWISICVDWGTGFIFRPVFTRGEHVRGDPNTASVVALLASVFIGQRFGDELVGGLPSVVIFDNARHHLSEECKNGYASLGVRVHAIRPGSPWENGRTESAVGVLEKEVWSQLPGYTHHLPTRYGKFPWERDALLSMRGLVAHTLQGIERINRDPSTRSGGGDGSRFQQWCASDGPLEFVDPSVVRHVFTRSPRPSYIVGKYGVHFQGVQYTHKDLGDRIGKRVTVRYLETDRSFIDVYEGDELLCRAVPVESTSREERTATVRSRLANEGEVTTILKRGAQAVSERARRLEVEAVFADADADVDVDARVPGDSRARSTPRQKAPGLDKEAAANAYLRLIEGGKE